MAALARAEEAVIELDETYQKQSFRNHCNIYGPNGLHVLSVPVVKVNGNHTKTRDIGISGHEPWQRIHWRSILAAYSNSPFFLYYEDKFRPFFEQEHRLLHELNSGLLQVILDILRLPVKISYTSVFEKKPQGVTDLREQLIGKHSGSAIPQPEYIQAFGPAHGFIPGLSILDLLFNLGPETRTYLKGLPMGESS